ncbi:uncharacterized protein [Ptychodera flava]|uniref:uncharacterized protein n=1 Tax=Ptychodera flava TaxID=63121 RepID=UPI00396A0CCE
MPARKVKKIIKILVVVFCLNVVWMLYKIDKNEDGDDDDTKTHEMLVRNDKAAESADGNEGNKDNQEGGGKQEEPVDQKPTPQKLEFLNNYPEVCKNVPDLQVVVLVTTAPHQVKLRAGVRQTWASWLKEKHKNIVVLFISGKSARQSDDQSLQNEINEHSDILKLDVVDSGKNETLKLIGSLQWVNEFCSNTRYLLQVSDRMLLVNDFILNFIKGKENSGIAMGSLREGIKPNRNQDSKFFMSEKDFPGDSYPAFLSSPVYLLSVDVVKRVHEKSLEIKRVPLEDVYLGILLQSVGVSPQNHAGFKLGYVNKPLDDFYGLCNEKAEFVWGFSGADQIRQEWGKLRQLSCEADGDPRQPQIIDENAKYKFITNHSKLCSEAEIHIRVTLLILVISSPEHEGRRVAIRETWAAYTKKLPGRRVQVIFIVGLSPDEAVNDKVLLENKKYQDLAIVNIEAPGKRRTATLLMGFEWVNSFCPSAKWVLKTEDHVVVNVDNMVRYIDTLPIMRVIVGKVIENEAPIRDEGNLRYVSETVFPDAVYPPYPDGAAYLMAQDIARDIMPSLRKKKQFPHDDLFFGVASKEMGFQMTNHQGFYVGDEQRSMCDLKFLLVATCPRVNLVVNLYLYWREWQWSEFEDCDQESSSFSHLSYDNTGIDGRFVPITDGAVSKPHSFDFRLNHPDKCKESGDVFLFAGILSSPANSSTRNSIRETWGKYYNKDQGNLNLVALFLLAIPPGDSELQTAVDEENAKYGDILQQTFMESYDHLVLKTLMLYRYVAEYCQNAKYVLKIDEDVFLHTDNMMAYLKDAPRNDFYLGDALVGTEPLRVIENKWYTPRHVWPHDTYPTYNAGPAYLMSGDLALKVYEASCHSKPFRWEDLYVGILVASVGGAPLPHNHFDMHGMYRHRCSVRQSLVSHHMHTVMYYRYWIQMSHLDATKVCEAPLHLRKDPIGSRPAGDAIQNVDWTRLDQYKCAQYANELKSPIFLLVVIQGPTLDYVVRKWLRTTWATSGVVQDKRIIVFFMVNKTPDQNVMLYLKNEHRMFLDVVVIDDKDPDYANKDRVIQALTWINLNCIDFSYAMIVKQPMYIDYDNVIDYLESVQTPKKLMLGKVIENQKPSRDREDDQYVSENDWPAEYFPPYCNTKAFLMSKFVAKGLYKSSKIVKPVANPGAYMGILLSTLLVKPTNHEGFELEDPKAIDQVCTKVNLLAADYIEWTSMTDLRMSGTMFKTCPKMTGSRRYKDLLKSLE